MRGHLRRRGEHSWEIKFDLGRDPSTGKRQTRYHSFKGTKRDAQAELTRLLSEAQKGTYVEANKETVASFLNRWDRDWAASNVSAKTLERYRQLIKNQILPQIGSMQIQKLRPVHLTELYGRLLNGGLAPRTVGHVHRVLHRAFGHAATWDIIQQNIAMLVEPPRVEAGEITVLTEDQIGRVLHHLEGRTMRPIIALALATGMRRGELLALRWQDVDLDGGRIKVERSLEQTRSGLRFKSPKTKHGRRAITIPPSIVTELRLHRAKQQERRLKLGLGRAPDDSLVFARWDGSTRSPHWLTQKFALAMAALGLPGVTLHSLRHSHASALIASGMDVLTISRRLGHASAAITLAVYGHLFRNTDVRAAEIMEATFAKAQRDRTE
jgi:integrase